MNVLDFRFFSYLFFQVQFLVLGITMHNPRELTYRLPPKTENSVTSHVAQMYRVGCKCGN